MAFSDNVNEVFKSGLHSLNDRLCFVNLMIQQNFLQKNHLLHSGNIRPNSIDGSPRIFGAGLNLTPVSSCCERWFQSLPVRGGLQEELDGLWP